jgi:molybdopterin-guanine dinucleotide biosynthesis protein A
VNTLLISRGDRSHRPQGFELLPDEYPGEGPLAGILAGLTRARSDGYDLLATFAGDTPFFPNDAVGRLWDVLCETSADYCVASRGGNEHHAIALWRVCCLEPLSTAFSAGLRSLHGVSDILWKTFSAFPMAGVGPVGDAFFNINTAKDLACAERWLTSHQAGAD